MTYPHGDALVPESFDEHTVIFLVRPADAPAFEPDERLRGISLYGVALDEALSLANADPMVRAGRLAIDGARWWTPRGTAVFGPRGG